MEKLDSHICKPLGPLNPVRSKGHANEKAPMDYALNMAYVA